MPAVPPLCPFDPTTALADRIADQFFPCVGAKSALATGGLSVIAAGALLCPVDDERILEALAENAASFRRDPARLYALAVVFAPSGSTDEQMFERQMWQRLQALSDRDAACEIPHDPDVSADPASPHFALSLGGHGYFVIGLHPAASRAARRFERPTLVFNLQAQFAVLRQGGHYEKMRRTIVDRDIALNGSANPMLSRFGDASAAPQFSGRAVGADWVCPLQPPLRRRRAA